MGEHARRRSIRFRFELEVEDVRRHLKARTRDISRDGMFVRGLAAELADRITVGVRFPDMKVPLRVHADVVRVERGGRDAALKVVHGALASRLAFESQVRRLSYAKTQPGEPPTH